MSKGYCQLQNILFNHVERVDRVEKNYMFCTFYTVFKTLWGGGFCKGPYKLLTIGILLGDFAK